MVVTLDEISLKEWQEKDLEHLRYEYPLTANDLVIDAGSYRGEFASEIKRRYGCRVEEYDPLNNVALWCYQGTIKTGGAYYYTSFYEQGGTEYPCVDVVEVFSHYAEIALMKINVEGCEYQLLKRMIEHGIISKVKYLQVQFHLIAGIDTDKLYESIKTELSKTHEIEWRYPFCWESWRRI